MPDGTLSCCAAVLAFSEVLADKGAHGKYSLSLYDSGRYMRLDAAAQRALHVVRGRGDANDSFSLTGLLNKGRTPMGKRLCKVGFWVYGLIKGRRLGFRVKGIGLDQSRLHTHG